MILEGANDIGCKGFAKSIRSITMFIVSTLEDSNREKLVDGKIIGRSSLIK